MSAAAYMMRELGVDPGSPYGLWLKAGNIGTERDFLESLKGRPGRSAYETWLAEGNVGTERDFLVSLKGEPGKPAYQWARPLPGEPGKDAYALWLERGNTGSIDDFLASLQGDPGLSAYQLWLSEGHKGSTEAFWEWLRGRKKDKAGVVVAIGAPGEPGARGPAGASGGGGSDSITLEAGVDLGGNRAVKPDGNGRAVYPSLGTPTDGAAIIGITTGAALTFDDAIVQTAGEMDEPSWTWTPGLPVYADDNGLLTQTPPVSGWVAQVGVAILATSLEINIMPSVVLA